MVLIAYLAPDTEQLRRQLVTARRWQDNIRQQQVDRAGMGAAHLHRFVSIGSREHFIALPLKHGCETVKVSSAWPASQMPQHLRCREVGIPCSRHDPKIAGSDDAEVVGDRITHCRPIPRNVFAQEAERRIGELGDGCVAFVVGDVSVHDAP